MAAEGARRHWADDGDLADEIELYGELVVAASESHDRLSLPEIDQVLGVSECPARAQGGQSAQTDPEAADRTVDVTDRTAAARDRGRPTAVCESAAERPVSHA